LFRRRRQTGGVLPGGDTAVLRTVGWPAWGDRHAWQVRTQQLAMTCRGRTVLVMERRPAAARTDLEVTSTANPRIKQLVALRRRRERAQAGVTLVEGHAEITLALAADIRPQAVYFCPGLVRSDDLAHQAAARGAQLFRVSRTVFEKISYREGPDGWLAVVPAVETGLSHLKLGAEPLVLACAGLEKPGNLGAILRTADAAGVTAVVAADPVTDWGNPNVVRASKGTVFSVPVASGTSAEVLAWIAGNRLRLVAASPDAQQPFTEMNLTGPLAIAVGAEQTGLASGWLERADVRVRIPMFGRADSLNVSTAAAILTYEAVRQRAAAGATRAEAPRAPVSAT
jgi:RNA methyltransferase, TrmH family